MTVQNSLQNRSQKKTFSNFLMQDAIKNKINEVVGGKDGQQFMTSILSAVSTNPALAECDHSTILSAAFLGTSLKLSPSPQLGQYYMVPFKDKNRGMIAQFILGYKGYIQLAIRSGYYKKINVIGLKEGELISYNPLDEEVEVKLIDDDVKREEMPSVGYYAMFEYQNGFKKAVYWSRAKMEAHALKYSAGYANDKKKGYSYTYWTKDFDGMAYKTLLRQLISKWGIMSIDMQNAVESDYESETATNKEVVVEVVTDEQPQVIQESQQMQEVVISQNDDFFE